MTDRLKLVTVKEAKADRDYAPRLADSYLRAVEFLAEDHYALCGFGGPCPVCDFLKAVKDE